MKSFTDIFIRRPVLGIVVNLILALVGWRALVSLPVQQFPQLESSSVIITTVYVGASQENVRGYLTTPIEQAVSQISGIDTIESESRAGISIITVRLQLDRSATAALAEVNARLQQVRSELPAEAEDPTVDIQRADRPYASFYLSFVSPERDVPEITDWLRRTIQPQLTTVDGVQRVSIEGGRPVAMRVWIDPDRLAAVNLAPGDVAAALQRNNFLAAVGKTKGDVGPGRPARRHRPALRRGVRGADRLGPRRRARAAARRRARRARRRGGRLAREVRPTIAAVYLGVWPVAGVNEIEVAYRPARRQMDAPATEAAARHRRWSSRSTATQVHGPRR
jgi:multidrug efflux pump